MGEGERYVCMYVYRQAAYPYCLLGPVNFLLVFVPIGIVAGENGWDPTTVFILNFLAIIPLAAVLSFATEEISVHLGDTLGGLLNATFGNAVELIVCFPLPPSFPSS